MKTGRNAFPFVRLGVCVLVGSLSLSSSAIDWKYYDRETRNQHLGGWDAKSQLLDGFVEGAGWNPYAWNKEPVREEACRVFMSIVQDLLDVREWLTEPNSSASKETKQQYDRQGYLYFGAKGAIECLGRLRYKPASGLLAEVARRSVNADVFCFEAASAVILIGDTNMLDFAKEVITAPHGRFPGAVYQIYRHLSPYMGVSSFKPVPLGTDENDWPFPADKKTRKDVELFVMSAITSEPGGGYEEEGDQRLSVASPEWAKSIEREAWLYKSSGEGYWGEQLRAIRALPASERTHVEVHPLRGPAPDLAVTNGPLAPAVEAILQETPSPAPPSAVTNAP